MFFLGGVDVYRQSCRFTGHDDTRWCFGFTYCTLFLAIGESVTVGFKSERFPNCRLVLSILKGKWGVAPTITLSFGDQDIPVPFKPVGVGFVGRYATSHD